jgi:hypothetical protein
MPKTGVEKWEIMLTPKSNKFSNNNTLRILVACITWCKTKMKWKSKTTLKKFKRKQWCNKNSLRKDSSASVDLEEDQRKQKRVNKMMLIPLNFSRTVKFQIIKWWKDSKRKKSEQNDAVYYNK